MRKNLLLTFLFLLVFTGCKDEEFQAVNKLSGTIWIKRYEVEDSDNLIDKDGNLIEGAEALAFGDGKVNYYILDKKDRVIRIWKTYDYKQKGDSYFLNNSKNGNLIKENMLYFDGSSFYRSNLKEADLDFSYMGK